MSAVVVLLLFRVEDKKERKNYRHIELTFLENFPEKIIPFLHPFYSLYVRYFTMLNITIVIHPHLTAGLYIFCEYVIGAQL